jgi:hypothetical protein
MSASFSMPFFEDTYKSGLSDRMKRKKNYRNLPKKAMRSSNRFPAAAFFSPGLLGGGGGAEKRSYCLKET